MKTSIKNLVFSVAFVAGIAGTAQAEEALHATAFESTRAMCNGDACAIFATLKLSPQKGEANPLTLDYGWVDQDGPQQNLLGAALGGLSGALIGDEIGGTAGAVGFGLLGAVLGYDGRASRVSEDEARRFQQAWQRGDDMYYNPAHPLPLNAHWLGGKRD